MNRHITHIKTFLKPLEGDQKKFYSEKLQKFKGDARKTWSVLKEILRRDTYKEIPIKRCHKILNSSN